jgi:hypothetical protein
MGGGNGRAGCLSAPRANQVAASLVLKAEATSGPGSHNPWPTLVGVQAAGPTWIGISESRAVRAPRGHVDDAGCQERQRRRQGTPTEKGE